MSNTLTGKITTVQLKKDKLEPILVKFLHADINPKNISDLKCKVYVKRNSAEESNRKRIVEVSSERRTYIGQNFGSAVVYNNDLSSTFLAIKNKRTSKIRLVETSQFLLTPSFPEQELTSSRPDKKNAVQALVNAFGSKRSRTQHDRIQKMHVKVETLEDQLNEAVESTVIEKDDLVIKMQDDERGHPKPNENARAVEDVYPLDLFLTEADLEELTEEAERCLDLSQDELEVEQEKYKYTDFFVSNLLVFKEQSKSPKMLLRTKLLVYMELLFNMVQATYKDFNLKSFVVCPFSQHINEKILSTFTETSPKGRNRSPKLRDTTCYYIFLLALLMNDFTIPVDVLAPPMKLSTQKCTTMCRSLGAYVRVGTDGRPVATLKLPLSKQTTPKGIRSNWRKN